MDLLLLRFFERMTVVLLSGMAIYLGFRLFLEVPELRDSAGKVGLPWDISVVMTRVGPGVFFALFGVAALSLALFRPLEIHLPGPGASEHKGGARLAYLGESILGDPAVHADARALLRKDIAVLNTIPRQLQADLPEHERAAIKRALGRVKLSLMKPVWGDAKDGFGDIAKFEEWMQAGEIDAPPAAMEGALALYRYGE